MTEGSSSHKKIAEDGSRYLRLYYTNNVNIKREKKGQQYIYIYIRKKKLSVNYFNMCNFLLDCLIYHVCWK